MKNPEFETDQMGIIINCHEDGKIEVAVGHELSDGSMTKWQIFTSICLWA